MCHLLFGCVYLYFFLNISIVLAVLEEESSMVLSLKEKYLFLLLKRNAVMFIPSLTEGKALISQNNGQTHQA